MSRPADLSYVVPVWAPNASYPVSADPWSATPTKTTHPGAASVGITPKTAVGAQVFNKVINDAYTAIGAGKTADQAILDHIGQLQALNFSLGATISLVDLVWNPGQNRWYGIEATTNCKNSTQNGWTWGVNEISGADTLHRIGCDPSGNMVITTAVTSGAIHEFNNSTGVWTRRTSNIYGGGSFLGITGRVVVAYEPTSALWYIGGLNTSPLGIIGATSPDRVTWTSRPSPIAGNESTIEVAAGNGYLVMVGRYNTGGVTHVATSANGGVSWTARADVAHGFTTGTTQELHFCSALGLFFMLVGDASTSHKLYSSTDGATWTLVHSVTTRAFARLSSVGRILVANLGNGQVVFSLNGGASWRFTGFAGGSTKIVTSGEQVILVAAAVVYPGMVAGFGHGAVY